MSDMLRLHYAPDNASLCVRLALEELQLPFETVLVDRTTQGHRSAAFLTMNPNGLIPVLETPAGPMFETGAILTWLADSQGALLPAVDAPQRGHAVQWMFWLANTLHPTLRTLFYPSQYIDGDTGALHAKARARLTAQLDLLADARNCDWLDGDQPSVHACYLAPMLRWAALYGGGPDWFDVACWPRLHGFAKRFELRHSAQAVAFAEGLGPTPFSHPHPCNPPEGSAL